MKPLLAGCQELCQPGLTSFCKAWQADSYSWTQGWTCSVGWGSPGLAVGGQDPWGKPRVGAWLFPWFCLHEPRAQASSTSPRQAFGPRSPPPLLWALSEAPLFAAWSGKIPPRPCESFQSHPLRLWALERNGSVFPLHGEQAGSLIRGRGLPPSPAH